MHHDLEALGRDVVELGCRRQIHRRRSAAGPRLECLVERPHELPAVQTTARGGGRTRREVGSQERVGQLPRLDRGRGHLSLGDRGRNHRDLHRGSVGDDELFRRQFGSGFEQPVPTHALRHRRRRLVGLEQLDERRVAGCRLGEDRRDSVEPLEQLDACGIGDLAVGLHSRALLAHQEGDHLELHPVRGSELAALRLRLDLAHLAREDRDEGCLVVATGRLLAPRGGGCRGRHAPPERESSGFPQEAMGRSRCPRVARARTVRTVGLLPVVVREIREVRREPISILCHDARPNAIARAAPRRNSDSGPASPGAPGHARHPSRRHPSAP